MKQRHIIFFVFFWDKRGESGKGGEMKMKNKKEKDTYVHGEAFLFFFMRRLSLFRIFVVIIITEMKKKASERLFMKKKIKNMKTV
jgi:hypothetical protein